jgi:hypothetical protein
MYIAHGRGPPGVRPEDARTVATSGYSACLHPGMAFATQAALGSLLFFGIPYRALAQPMEHQATRDCCGGMMGMGMGMGIGMMILVALLVLAATGALVAAAVFLMRRSRERRP